MYGSSASNPDAASRSLRGRHRAPRKADVGMSEEQNRRGLQRALRGVTEGLAMQAEDSCYVRSLAMYRCVLCEALGVLEGEASRQPPPESSPPGDEQSLAA